jgi:hypothetical protein
MQKLLSRLGLLIVIINFNGCGKLPAKPSIDSGIVIQEINEIFYVNSTTGSERSLVVCMDDGSINPKLNKEITHSNEDWNKVLLYIRLLEEEVPKNVKNKLRKFRVKLNETHHKLIRKSYGL